MNILVVDDEMVSRKKLEKILSTISECTAVESGDKALRAVKSAIESKKYFDLIFLDIVMPGMNGQEALDRIRNLEKSHNIPKNKKTKILMVTSHSDLETVMACVYKGCDDYIVKPFDKETVFKKIDQLLPEF